jgi:hypothetical protein
MFCFASENVRNFSIGAIVHYCIIIIYIVISCMTFQLILFSCWLQLSLPTGSQSIAYMQVLIFTQELWFAKVFQLKSDDNSKETLNLNDSENGRVQ